MIRGLASSYTIQWNTFLEGFRYPLLAAAISLVIVLILTPWVKKLAISKGAVDDPTRDDRRVHTVVTPRWGGLAIYGGILLTLAILLPFAYPFEPFPPYLIAIVVLSAVLLCFGLMDDLKQYSSKIQMAALLLVGLGVQVFYSDVGRVQVAGVTLPGDQWIDFGIWAWPLTAIYIFVVTKTMDTIDGIDGLTSGIAAIAATTLGVIATLEGQPRVALIALTIAGACIGFLRFNYNPAKIFMGTGGAQVLGFLLASLSIVGAMKTATALAVIVPLCIFGLPLFDAAFVVIKRVISGTPITQPDKRHLHHTLLNRGYSQRQTVWILYLVAIALSGLILFLVRQYG